MLSSASLFLAEALLPIHTHYSQFTIKTRQSDVYIYLYNASEASLQLYTLLGECESEQQKRLRYRERGAREVLLHVKWCCNPIPSHLDGCIFLSLTLGRLFCFSILHYFTHNTQTHTFGRDTCTQTRDIEFHTWTERCNISSLFSHFSAAPAAKFVNQGECAALLYYREDI